jgi:hypothetical protein
MHVIIYAIKVMIQLQLLWHYMTAGWRLTCATMSSMSLCSYQMLPQHWMIAHVT